MKYDSIFVVPVLMILLGFAPQTFAAVDMFLKIDDVKGEVVDKAHQGEIDVLAWSWGGSQSGTTHRGTGGGAGKAAIQDLSITKWVDSATPILLEAMATGGHYKRATLTLRRAGVRGKQAEYFVMAMEDVIVTSVLMAGSGGEDRLTENMTLNFAKFQISYRPTKEDGSAMAPVEVEWDIAKNAP
jgi:type VI secretion system secreted protein Hcp